MTSALVDFLLARIAEDEADASFLVGNGQWHASRDELSLTWDVSTGQTGDTLTVGYVGNRDSEPCARHIARHDPARVLAECAAKRRIVREVSFMKLDVLTMGWVLSELAAPYSDHPDYDPTWTPMAQAEEPTE